MSGIGGSAGMENRENTRTIEVGGVLGAVLNPRAETKNMTTRVCLANGPAICLCAVEQRARTGSIGDAEGVLGEGVQNTMWVAEFEGFGTGVVIVAVTFRFSNP